MFTKSTYHLHLLLALGMYLCVVGGVCGGGGRGEGKRKPSDFSELCRS